MMRSSANSVWENKDSYHVIVVGAGHAGCEAALACARLGLKTAVFTLHIDHIAMMPCNPNIGGTSKGHLVREVDALGGQMAKNIDQTFIQSKMLNTSKGPAVHSLRAQADKQAYSNGMRKALENQEGLAVLQAEVAEICAENIQPEISSEEGKYAEEPGTQISQGMKRVTGIKTVSGHFYEAEAVILCTGTYLSARCIYGDVSIHSGPNGLSSADHLTASLNKIGIPTRRFKTGTPCRIDGSTVDYSKLEEQKGDVPIVPFSFSTNPDEIQKEQISCWLTSTNEKTHEVIRKNLDRSPLFSGVIEGVGPRYCPSIEDKVVRFPDKKSHQVFIEPEGLYTNEVYIDGMSSSMPEDVQQLMYTSVKGLENARIVRPAYAIEYDCIDARQLKLNLEFKSVEGLFSAGQFNGSSGYEEAAAQGIMAGINAAAKILGRDPVILKRSDGYTGVLIDDLVTKESHEPYRMMTARAEYRLLLRQDNADERMMPMGHDIGLVDEETYRELLESVKRIEAEAERLKNSYVGPTEPVTALLEEYSSTPLSSGVSLAELIRRPELDYEKIAPIDPERPRLTVRERDKVNTLIKYEGYIRRQERQVEQFKKLETRVIPETFSYDGLEGIRKEALEKLKKMRPASIGQASRISGVSPADISVLLVYLKKYAKENG